MACERVIGAEPAVAEGPVPGAGGVGRQVGEVYRQGCRTGQRPGREVGDRNRGSDLDPEGPGIPDSVGIGYQQREVVPPAVAGNAGDDPGGRIKLQPRRQSANEDGPRVGELAALRREGVVKRKAQCGSGGGARRDFRLVESDQYRVGFGPPDVRPGQMDRAGRLVEGDVVPVIGAGELELLAPDGVSPKIQPQHVGAQAVVLRVPGETGQVDVTRQVGRQAVRRGDLDRTGPEGVAEGIELGQFPLGGHHDAVLSVDGNLGAIAEAGAEFLAPDLGSPPVELDQRPDGLSEVAPIAEQGGTAAGIEGKTPGEVGIEALEPDKGAGGIVPHHPAAGLVGRPRQVHVLPVHGHPGGLAAGGPGPELLPGRVELGYHSLLVGIVGGGGARDVEVAEPVAAQGEEVAYGELAAPEHLAGGVALHQEGSLVPQLLHRVEVPLRVGDHGAQPARTRINLRLLLRNVDL